MIYGSAPKFVIRFSMIIEKRLLKIEITLIFIGLIGILIGSFHKDLGELILTLPLVTLSCAYYFLAFRLCDNNFDRFISKLINLPYSVSIISILFVMNNWPGGLLIHQLAMITNLMSLLAILFLDKVLKKTTIIDSTNVIRTFIVLALLLLLHLSPGYKELRERQDMIEAELDSIK